MTRRLGLIVTDASPLITLAAGEALECLAMPGAPVTIPVPTPHPAGARS